VSQDSGAWLIVRPRLSSPEHSEPVALPVPRQACLGLARAVLAKVDDAARWLALVGEDSAVAAWIAAVGKSPPLLFSRLAEDLVVGALPAGVRSAALAGVVGPAPEALLLADAVERMREHERLSARFDDSLKAARLEAARELAYGAGHEINNPLANIATRAQSLLLEERDPERRRRLATIVDQSFRARDMIGGLMLFARPPKPTVEPADVGGIIAGVVEAARGQAAARGISLESNPRATAIEVVVDRGQIEEALRAVVTNAIEAVGSGGRVTIASRSVDDIASWCEITVADDGCGMDDATVRRAFDPFFSGREAGRGAGLGLSKAWRFIETNGGSVAIASRPGAGTTVAVRLPVAAAGRVAPDSPV
jgi:signal transduction histidine kinase